MAACAAVQEVVWLVQLLKEFTCTFFSPVILLDDTKECVEYAKNNEDVGYHFISDLK